MQILYDFVSMKLVKLHFPQICYSSFLPLPLEEIEIRAAWCERQKQLQLKKNRRSSFVAGTKEFSVESSDMVHPWKQTLLPPLIKGSPPSH